MKKQKRGRPKKYKNDVDRKAAHRRQIRKYAKKNYKPKYKYNIGDLKFTSKNATIKYVRQKLNDLGCCEIDGNHVEFMFLMNLIKNHPNSGEKIGCGVSKFIISMNKLNKRAKHLDIQRIDGSIIDISWKISAGSKPPNSLLQAMRYAIKDQMLEYKNKADPECVICQSLENLQVDHKNPSFKTISNSYIMLKNNITPTTFGDDKHTHQHIFKVVDYEFENEWQQYHKQNATYQILCKTCNIKKGAKN